MRNRLIVCPASVGLSFLCTDFSGSSRLFADAQVGHANVAIDRKQSRTIVELDLILCSCNYVKCRDHKQGAVAKLLAPLEALVFQIVNAD